MSSDDITAITLSAAAQARRADPRLDDWLGDEASIEWFPGSAEAEARDGRERRARRGEAGGARATNVLTPAQELAQVYRRRRLGGLVAVVVLVAAAILAAVVLLGGSSSPVPRPVATPSTSTAATSTTTTTSTASSGTTSTPTSPKSSATTTKSTTPALVLPASGMIRTGATGATVKELQQDLTTLGSDPGKADGTFGPLTEQAVIAYQQSNGLSPDGIVGPKTVAKINAALAAGSG
jgi:Putative peptidoglycan binding domain